MEKKKKKNREYKKDREKGREIERAGKGKIVFCVHGVSSCNLQAYALRPAMSVQYSTTLWSIFVLSTGKSFNS